MAPLPANSPRRLQLSVSAIEQADAVLRAREPQRPLAADPLHELDGALPGDPAALGTVVHAVVERLEATGPADVELLIQAALRGLSPTQVRSVSIDAVRRRLAGFVNSDVWSRLTAAVRWFREIDFLLAWPPASGPAGESRAVISGQLDCLYRDAAGHWTIIDYKTGRLPRRGPEQSAADALWEHFDVQLVLYAEAVRALIGSYPEALEIVLLHDELTSVPIELSADRLDPVRKRIDKAIAHLSVPRA
jgi:ATP-dependent exoDNAse (exonuclease V) beta subunit